MNPKIKKILPELRENVLLKDYTTFKIGGPAKYFFVAREKDDLIRAIETAKKFKLPVFILGGGSNLLISDKGFKGLVIKLQVTGCNTQGDKIFVFAGMSLTGLADFAAQNGFKGFEWSAGIPGTVGGAIFGNAQAFGDKISDLVESVEVLDTKTLKIKKLSKKQCRFSLKNSVFKKNKNLVIISIVFYTQKDDKEKIKEKTKELLNYRKSHHPISFPSAGSTFVNPEVKIKNKKLLEKFPELIEANKIGVIRSGYLIEKVGLKGKKIGGAQISEQHANFIINLGNAKAKDVTALIGLAQKKVKEVFGVSLEEEVQFVGFKN